MSNKARKKIKQRKITSMHIRNLPVDLKAQFKAYCAAHDCTMERAVEVLIKRAVQDDTSLRRYGNRGT